MIMIIIIIGKFDDKYFSKNNIYIYIYIYIYIIYIYIYNEKIILKIYLSIIIKSHSENTLFSLCVFYSPLPQYSAQLAALCPLFWRFLWHALIRDGALWLHFSKRSTKLLNQLCLLELVVFKKAHHGSESLVRFSQLKMFLIFSKAMLRRLVV